MRSKTSYNGTRFGKKVPRPWYERAARRIYGAAGGVAGFYGSGGSFYGVAPGYNIAYSHYGKRFPRKRVSFLRSNSRVMKGPLTGSNPSRGPIFGSNPPPGSKRGKKDPLPKFNRKLGKYLFGHSRPGHVRKRYY